MDLTFNDVVDVSLLSEAEYKQYSKIIPYIPNAEWWLKDAGEYGSRVATVLGGTVNHDAASIPHGVRPVVTLAPEFGGKLTLGETITLGEKTAPDGSLVPQTYTVIGGNRAICDELVADIKFREGRSLDAKEYDQSDIKIWLANWYERNLELSATTRSMVEFEIPQELFVDSLDTQLKTATFLRQANEVARDYRSPDESLISLKMSRDNLLSDADQAIADLKDQLSANQENIKYIDMEVDYEAAERMNERLSAEISALEQFKAAINDRFDSATTTLPTIDVDRYIKEHNLTTHDAEKVKFHFDAFEREEVANKEAAKKAARRQFEKQHDFLNHRTEKKMAKEEKRAILSVYGKSFTNILDQMTVKRMRSESDRIARAAYLAKSQGRVHDYEYYATRLQALEASRKALQEKIETRKEKLEVCNQILRRKARIDLKAGKIYMLPADKKEEKTLTGLALIASTIVKESNEIFRATLENARTSLISEEPAEKSPAGSISGYAHMNLLPGQERTQGTPEHVQPQQGQPEKPQPASLTPSAKEAPVQNSQKTEPVPKKEYTMQKEFAPLKEKLDALLNNPVDTKEYKEAIKSLSTFTDKRGVAHYPYGVEKEPVIAMAYATYKALPQKGISQGLAKELTSDITDEKLRANTYKALTSPTSYSYRVRRGEELATKDDVQNAFAKAGAILNSQSAKVAEEIGEDKRIALLGQVAASGTMAICNLTVENGSLQAAKEFIVETVCGNYDLTVALPPQMVEAVGRLADATPEILREGTQAAREAIVGADAADVAEARVSEALDEMEALLANDPALVTLVDESPMVAETTEAKTPEPSKEVNMSEFTDFQQAKGDSKQQSVDKTLATLSTVLPNRSELEFTAGGEEYCITNTKGTLSCTKWTEMVDPTDEKSKVSMWLPVSMVEVTEAVKSDSTSFEKSTKVFFDYARSQGLISTPDPSKNRDNGELVLGDKKD